MGIETAQVTDASEQEYVIAQGLSSTLRSTSVHRSDSTDRVMRREMLIQHNYGIHVPGSKFLVYTIYTSHENWVSFTVLEKDACIMSFSSLAEE